MSWPGMLVSAPLRLVAGAIAGGVLASGSLAVLMLAGSAVGRLDHSAGLDLHGRAVSEMGGVRVLVERRTSRIDQDCLGACDDLRLTGGDTVREVKVFGADGGCIACRRYGLLSSNRGPAPPAVFKRDVK